jgi:hypothetical protein
MLPVRYKVLVDGKGISKADLDRIDTITVTQRMDQTAEASISLLIQADQNGQWQYNKEIIKPLRPVRVEIQVGNGGYRPLIEGPLVGADPQLQSEPGRSLLILRVHDDSYSLTLDKAPDQITGNDDAKLASEIFDKVQNVIKEKDVAQDLAPPPSDRTTAIRPTGTLLDALRWLAARHPKVHAWVKPGITAGKSKGMFQLEDDKASDLPALVLFGSGRNIDSFSVTQDLQRPTTVTGSSLDITNLSVKTAKASYGDVLDGGQPAVDEGQVGTTTLPPGFDIGFDLEGSLKAVAAQYAVVYEAQGVVRNFCYAGVLEPYRRVRVTAVGKKISGDWLIRSVTHTITRSDYSQAFALERRDDPPPEPPKPDSATR